MHNKGAIAIGIDSFTWAAAVDTDAHGGWGGQWNDVYFYCDNSTVTHNISWESNGYAIGNMNNLPGLPPSTDTNETWIDLLISSQFTTSSLQ